MGHCLLRRQPQNTPNATFRSWAMNSASLNVLVAHLEYQAYLVERAIYAAAQRVDLARAANAAALEKA